MTIHASHPFLPPEPERRPLRRLRGRLVSPVTVWTAAAPAATPGTSRPVGLTVSSTVVADGEPGEMVGLLNPDSDLFDALVATGRAAISVLAWQHRQIADALAGLSPAPGGGFGLGSWEPTPWGPVPADAPAWVGVRLVGRPEAVGWSMLVRGEVESVTVGAEGEPLAHLRGRYRTL